MHLNTVCIFLISYFESVKSHYLNSYDHWSTHIIFKVHSISHNNILQKKNKKNKQTNHTRRSK